MKLCIPHSNIATDAQAAHALDSMLSCVSRLAKVHKYLTTLLITDEMGEVTLRTKDDPQGLAPDFCFNPDLLLISGYTPEDFLRDKVQMIWGTLPLDTMIPAAQEMWFDKVSTDFELVEGGTDVSLKLFDAIRNLQLANTWVVSQNDLNVYTPKEWKTFAEDVLKPVIGAMAYSLGYILSIRTVIEGYINHAEFVEDGVYRELRSRYNRTPLTISNMLAEISQSYQCVVPLFESNPAKWYALCADVDPVLLDSFVDLGNYMTFLDFRAIDAGIVKFDESYLSILEARAQSNSDSENGDFLPLSAPEDWRAFEKKVPDSLVDYFLTALDAGQLTAGMISPIAQGEEITASYIQVIREMCKTLPPTGIPEYDKEEKIERTSKFPQ